MSFLVTAALAIGFLIALPAIAHFLRSGRAAVKPFPPAALVLAARTVARSERRLEDRLLLALRALAVIALALLGATPFVSCSRLSLARGAGGSLAVAIVLDDSLSMRAAPGGGRTRFERARDAARQLLDSTREGDSISIVLAGRPARLLLGATTDLRVARRTLNELTPSDRATDLAAALVLARGSLRDAERRELRVVVLSDFAGPPLTDTKGMSAPLPDLTRAAPDCGIASAERQGDRVTATVACNRAAAAEGRALEIVPLADSGVDPSASAGARKPGSAAAIAGAPLDTRAGTQVVGIKLPPNAPALAVRLNGSDALAHDDLAAVAPDTLALGVAVLADTALSSGETGGPPLVEQAIRALENDVALRPLAVLPDQTTELDGYGLLVLD
ncbi:MAG TPA: VWA domain-containing protein, partial [Polyangiaceae bacterium]|nr:VWA domain-containing protein [Polyangiaceae bacterium]